ncbi:unnamed protein product [Clonostachys rosea f. rosea IK726]|uniref:Uncharacterized protein n=1 Tax=Clonostachys rosea f. rosea IK726 TaxID=1349383 RepID=A0ACA9UVP5_BIOOC|nr:unnamed protein product [Clonostachys rosea f. rosea IK726]
MSRPTMAYVSPGPAGVLAPQWTLVAVAGCILIALFHLRLNIQKRRLLTSDILMCVTWCFAVITSAFDIKLALLGALDYDVLYTLEGYRGDSADILLIIKLRWSSTIPFIITCWLCKATLLTVYLKVFPAFMVKRRILLWTTLGYIILCPIVTLIEMFRICIPLERNWTGDRCVVVGGMRLLRISWGLHFAGSLIVFALPWLILPDLQLKGSLRMGVYYTFLLGLADIAVCLTRYIIIELAAAKRPPSMSLLQLLVALDYTLSLVIACLPSLRPYFRAHPRTSTDKSSNPTPSTTTKKSDCGPTSLAERELMEDS